RDAVATSASLRIVSSSLGVQGRYVRAPDVSIAASQLLGQQREDGEVDATALPLAVAGRAEHSLLPEAGLLGDALRRLVLHVRAQLQPAEPARPDRPTRHQSHRARRDAATARLTLDPVADLADGLLVVEPVDADRAERLAGLRHSDRERRDRGLPPAPPGRGEVLARIPLGVRLRDLVQP